jgi:hypothetical protein
MSLQDELRRVFNESEQRSLDSIPDDVTEAERLGQTIRANNMALLDCLVFLAGRIEVLEQAVDR